MTIFCLRLHAICINVFVFCVFEHFITLILQFEKRRVDTNLFGFRRYFKFESATHYFFKSFSRLEPLSDLYPVTQLFANRLTAERRLRRRRRMTANERRRRHIGRRARSTDVRR